MRNLCLCCATIAVGTFGCIVATDAYAAEAQKAPEQAEGKLSLKVDLALPSSESRRVRACTHVDDPGTGTKGAVLFPADV